MRVVAIGAGVGGLTLALLLGQRGIEADVLERSPELREVGTAVALSANGTRVLRHLGLGEKLAAISLEPAAIIHRDGRVIAVTRRPRLVPRPVRRSLLQRGEDGAAAPARGRPRRRAAAPEQRGDGDARAPWWRPGAAFEADVAVGADGVHSMTRGWLTGGTGGTGGTARTGGARRGGTAGQPGRPVYSGASGFRGLVPVERMPMLPDPDAAQVWMGPGAHVVTYPVPVNGVPMTNFLAVADAPMQWTAPTWTYEAEPGAHLKPFTGWHPLLDTAPQSPRWGLFASRPLTWWSRGRVTLLGDTAHAMLPHYGQGANQSIEDAAVLAAELDASPREPAAALRRYEHRRLARTRKLQKLSWDASADLHLPDGPAARRRDEGLPGLAERMAWIHEYDALAR